MKRESLVFTPEGIETYRGKLEQLKAEREEKIRTNSEADVSFLNERIESLERILGQAVETSAGGGDSRTIRTGAVVKLRDTEFSEDMTYKIVNRLEADPLQCKLSEESPLGRLLISKQPGDQVTVSGPGGTLTYEILAVDYADT